VADNIIELAGLTKMYDSFTAVDHLNLNIRKGEIFGLLGPNGAGKSTTILMMMGLTEPTSGMVKVCGLNPTTSPIDVKKKVGYLPEDVGFYDDRTGLENLVYTARLNSLSGKESQIKAMQLIERVGLTEAAHKKTGKYSRGMRQRLGLADVLIKSPEVIILDEPTLGIDPKGVKEFLELIVKLSREEGLTVLFSSHHLHQVQQVCDRVGLFVKGNLLAEGDIQSLSAKLYGNSPYIIEIEVSEDNGSLVTEERLKNILKEVKNITHIKLNGDKFQIDCSADITAGIARAIVQSGAGLHSMSKKEFGLDDIYYRYFEGGETNE
jgi:ABC-2 type transport system ATP-binding protein